MATKKYVTIDGNTAAAHIAYAFSDVAAIYPITPSSPMAEYSEQWASMGRENLWGRQVDVMEMQSEAGAAGAVHGSLVAGALTTTFTASQGLLLMIPNMFKIAGEMLPCVFHVSARSIAAQSLSIFGDHSDVMACRQTGFAMTCASSIQETMDMALVAHLSTLEAQVPFLNFFDGFRTSHEYQKVEEISYDDIRSLVDEKLIARFRARAQKPEHPQIHVASQNEDVYFQGRESSNKYYDAVPGIVQKYMDKVAALTGRQYHLFDYVGAPDATDVVVVMGSAADTFEWAVEYMNERGAKVGVLKVRLYRPFSASAFVDAIPASVKRIAVMDRTKEPGSLGEPLFLDVVAALKDQGRDAIKVIGGRYGLSSKDFTPSHAKAVFDFLASKDAFHGFTVGINDDVTHKSIPVNDIIDVTPKGVVSCMFYGLGSDGTVGANKNSIKIIGDNTNQNAQAYFAYDSKKSGGITISHLRFGEGNLDMPWLIDHADFVACHNPAYIGRYAMLDNLKEGGVFLLNSAIPSDVVFEHLPRHDQEIIINRKIRFYNINALAIAQKAGLGTRINTVMQAAFFKICGVLPEDEAIDLIKQYAKKTFIKKGEEVVKKNWAAIDGASEALVEVKVPATITKSLEPKKLIPDDASDFAKHNIEPIMHLKGNDIPVSCMSFDGTLPSGTAKLEKRGVAAFVPHWDSSKCIQCNQCVQSCPHAAIRAKQITPEDMEKAPETFKAIKSNTKNDRNLLFKIQVYTEDCQGCGVCVEACPAKEKALEMVDVEKERAAGEVQNAEFFEALTYDNLDGLNMNTVKGLQFKQPLFEFSGACAGCGETPYVKMLSQICGERAVIANATGCSSIYSGTYPTIPYTKRADGRGPAWGNSLFEDNAEYGLGMRLAIDSNRGMLKAKCDALMEKGCSAELKAAIEKCYSLWDDMSEASISAQNELQAVLAKEKASDAESQALLDKIVELQDYFAEKNVLIIGGDGWAYDIGYGGVDHVLASGKNVTILVLDTEVYSNTGGQASKSTPLSAVAKFANSGKKLGKKNMGFMCMSYGYVYVASCALGYNRLQAQKCLQEAVAYKGPSIVFCYAPCINHGINMRYSQVEAKKAVEAGYWPLYRFNPEAEKGKRFTWETKPATADYISFIKGETRYSSLTKTNPAHAEELFAKAAADAAERLAFYEKTGAVMGEIL
ncbi:MAG: pyruvate:ferredoxin (flavodoxin) oxidoreductase [Spirochaetes bacterium]|uniref:Pyruvate:ferredoxin (Flavodoxin) oxidoreductase n=1 Tax=Candidatus Aphodenecus pullistercoris TaxID=2840669 RepID=A0A9D9E9H1_9SPIR|nr:pyruvate:ferredoxin (flavodoxin) oxidoreductase [Candidatus Aphodenecus pullistercoris]